MMCLAEPWNGLYQIVFKFLKLVLTASLIDEFTQHPDACLNIDVL